jgi:N-acetylmuramoyl-L-alanine amidase
MIICVDPGHGMNAARMGLYDPGAVASLPGERFEEADVALDWSLELGQALRDRGQTIHYTRQNRTDPAPTVIRATRAVNWGCRVLVSVHCNAFHTALANGTETLYRSPASETPAKVVNAALVKVLDTVDRGAKYRPELAVLKFPHIAILVELGFITHAGDREKLLNPELRAQGVDAIASSLLKSLSP